MPRHSFQFTPLREGRPAAPCFAVVIVSDFNSRPSARGDRAPSPCRPRSKRISIHAPPRGATRQRLPARRRPPHFNSRPSARGDAAFASAEWAKRNFNSRPSARGDAFALLTILGVVVFQFTPLREGRHSALIGVAGSNLFQFTPLREGRPPGTAGKSFSTPFQFTPLREGRRNQRGEAVRRVNISIHAPPRGATVSTGPKNITYQFQFTPLREGRRTSRTTGCKRHSFQFTPLREGRRGVSVHHGADGKISIHAPPRGATRTSSPL